VLEFELQGLSKAYNLPQEQRCVVALQRIDFSMEVGEFVSIVGPSGCGKSTLLRLLAGFEQKSDGVVLHRGVPVDGPSHRRSFIPQDSGLFPWLSIEENVMLPLHVKSFSSPQKREKAYACMERAGIASFAKAYPWQLSGGMKQRAALARAVAMESHVVLMDEPFSALDEASREAMDEAMLGFFRENNMSVVMVTHAIREALLLSDRVVVMASQPGRIFSTLTPPLPKASRYHALEISTLHEAILETLKGAVRG